ncbi:MAG: 2-phosphoglycerate kinase [Cyanobacteria bacterium P01_A01_bin.83]
MSNLINQPQIILIGGTSHLGKSTLGKALSLELKGKYIATDSLARHPGRPWSIGKNKTIKPHVVEHYRSLSAPQLLSNVLLHYYQNVLPLVRNLIKTHDCQDRLIIEGSALYPGLVKDLVSNKNVRGLWLVGSYSLLANRIFDNSNFDNANKKERYLIYKFLQRTWLYNQAAINDLKTLGLKSIQVKCDMTVKELKDRCLWELEISNDTSN